MLVLAIAHCCHVAFLQTPVRGPPPPQHPPESSAEDAPEKQPGEKAEKEDSAPDARVEWKQAAADGQALARMNESEEKRPVPSDALANGARHERAGVSAVEQVANPAEDEVRQFDLA